MTEVQKRLSEEMTAYSINKTRTTGHQYVKGEAGGGPWQGGGEDEEDFDSYSHYIEKLTQNRSQL